MSKITLGWAEDNQYFISGTRRFINSVAGDWIDFLFIVGNGQEMVNALDNQMPDIVLMDIRMPVMNGIEATKIIIHKYPNLKIIAFTEFDFEHNVVEMNKAGVKSFVAKSQAAELVRAIEIVSDGGVYFPDEVAEILQRYLNKTMPLPEGIMVTLNEFERQLLFAIAKGKSSTQIGHQLSRSARTIEDYRQKLYLKFGVKNKEELIVKAVHHNFLKIP